METYFHLRVRTRHPVLSPFLPLSSENLTRFKKPKSIEFAPDLPKNPYGKIGKKYLKKNIGRGAPGGSIKGVPSVGGFQYISAGAFRE